MQQVCHTLESLGRKENWLTDFTDDLVLFTNKSKLMQLMTDWLESIGKKVGLKISVNMIKMEKIGDPKDDAIFLEEFHWKQLKTF